MCLFVEQSPFHLLLLHFSVSIIFVVVVVAIFAASLFIIIIHLMMVRSLSLSLSLYLIFCGSMCVYVLWIFIIKMAEVLLLLFYLYLLLNFFFFTPKWSEWIFLVIIDIFFFGLFRFTASSTTTFGFTIDIFFLIFFSWIRVTILWPAIFSHLYDGHAIPLRSMFLLFVCLSFDRNVFLFAW